MEDAAQIPGGHGRDAGGGSDPTCARPSGEGIRRCGQPHPVSRFRVGAINDEISRRIRGAFDEASREVGMERSELRSEWNNNWVNLLSSQVAEAQRMPRKYELIDVAGPVCHVDWKGPPQPKFSTAHDFHADLVFDQQNEVP
jgi:hypothetical protein